MKNEISIREYCLEEFDALLEAKPDDDDTLMTKVTYVNYCSIYNICRKYLESDNVEHVLMMCTPFVTKTLFWVVAHEIGAPEYAEKYEEFVEMYMQWYWSDEILKNRKSAIKKFLKEYTIQEYRTTDFPNKYVAHVHYKTFNLLKEYSDAVNPKYYEALMNDIKENKNFFEWDDIIRGNPEMLMWFFLYIQGNLGKREIFDEYQDSFFDNSADDEKDSEEEYTKIFDAVHELVMFCYEVVQRNDENDTEYIRVCLENLKEFLWTLKNR